MVNFKKIFIVFLLINIILVSCVYCDDIDEDSLIIDHEVLTSSLSSDEPEIFSKYAIVFERNSKAIIYEKNSNEKCPMASTTKIMTAIIIIENCDLNDIVTVSKSAASTGGSRLGLKENDKLSILDLLYGLMLCSGNDAAATLAEYYGESIDGFASIMNNKASSLRIGKYSFYYSSWSRQRKSLYNCL